MISFTDAEIVHMVTLVGQLDPDVITPANPERDASDVQAAISVIYKCRALTTILPDGRRHIGDFTITAQGRLTQEVRPT